MHHMTSWIMPSPTSPSHLSLGLRWFVDLHLSRPKVERRFELQNSQLNYIIIHHHSPIYLDLT